MKLRVGLIGMGNMGRNHVRLINSMETSELAGILDTALPGDVNEKIFNDIDEFFEQEFDCCILATPVSTHEALAQRLAEERIPSLIEKPIAGTREEARRIATLFADNQTPLAVGHIERFNPAIQELRSRILDGQLGKPEVILSTRLSGGLRRVLDTGVVHDLATHDIDLTHFLTGMRYTAIDAQTYTPEEGQFEDHLSASCRLASRAIVTHLVGRNWPKKERTFQVIGERGSLIADTLYSDLYFYEAHGTEQTWNQARELRGEEERSMIRYTLPRHEPLEKELEAFFGLVRDGNGGDLAFGHDGVKAVEVADLMIASANKVSQPVAH